MWPETWPSCFLRGRQNLLKPKNPGKILIGPVWVMCLFPGSISLGRGVGQLREELHPTDPATRGPSQVPGPHQAGSHFSARECLLLSSCHTQHLARVSHPQVRPHVPSAQQYCRMLFPFFLPLSLCPHRMATSGTLVLWSRHVLGTRGESKGRDRKQLAQGQARWTPGPPPGCLRALRLQATPPQEPPPPPPARSLWPPQPYLPRMVCTSPRAYFISFIVT